MICASFSHRIKIRKFVLLYWDRSIQTDRLDAHNHPEVVIRNKRAHHVKSIDITVSLDRNTQLSYTTKIQKYSQLKHAITDMQKVDRVLTAAEKAILVSTSHVVRSFFDYQEVSS